MFVVCTLIGFVVCVWLVYMVATMVGLCLLLSWCLLLLFGLTAVFWVVYLVFCWHCVVNFCVGGFVV